MSKMAFPAGTTRFLLFLFNVVFLVTSVAVAAAAIIIQFSFSDRAVFIEENLTSPPIIIAIACGIICLVSIFGCCGVIKESRYILFLFSILLFVIFIVEIAAGIFIYQKSEVIGKEIHVRMETSMKSYNNSNNTSIKRSWDALQYDFSCCGIDGPKQWGNGSAIYVLPASCCTNLTIKDTCFSNLPEVHKSGCYTKFEEFVKSKFILLAIIAFGVGITQLLCSIASCLLARYINKQYEAV